MVNDINQMGCYADQQQCIAHPVKYVPVNIKILLLVITSLYYHRYQSCERLVIVNTANDLAQSYIQTHFISKCLTAGCLFQKQNIMQYEKYM